MIRDDLLTLRLLLANQAPPAQVIALLDEIGHRLDAGDGPFRELMRDCLADCREQVQAGRFDDALREVQLIHNLPASPGELDGWDEAHFFQVELFSYLEGQRDVDRIKRILSLIAHSHQRA
jgi:hypothetical protein